VTALSTRAPTFAHIASGYTMIQHLIQNLIQNRTNQPLSAFRLRSIVSLFAVTAASCACPLAAADTVFVNAAQALPSLIQTGGSWALAYKSLQTALVNAGAGDEIWVAEGVYHPTTTGLQTASFTPPDGVRVLGRFAVGDGLESDRDPIANLTILSGAIGAAGTADNSQHVIRATNVSGTEFDGFIITGGNADSGGVDATGGALLVEGAAGSTDITFRRCDFVSNDSVSAGGAVSIAVGGAVFARCTFRLNTSNNGGAFNADAGPVTLLNCRFLGNDGVNGGALRFVNSDGSALYNCLFSGNAATPGSGGAIQLAQSDTLLFACTIVNNSAASTGGGIRMDTAMVATLRNTIVFDNTASGLTSQIFVGTGASLVKLFCDIEGIISDVQGNFSSDPLFVNALGVDGVAGTLDDDVRLRSKSPCVDRGDTSLFVGDLFDIDDDGNINESLPIDIGGGPRMIDDLEPDEGGGSAKFHDVGAFEFDRPGTVLCVDAAAAPGGDGSTWANSFSSLQSALAVTNTQTLTAPVQIWIAAGTYKPTTGTDRTKSFAISKSVAIYGGFSGVEASILDRFPQASPVFLSGDIGVAGDADNSFRVVDVNVPTGTADVLIDGVAVMHGNSFGMVGLGGAGIHVAGGAGAKATIRDCRIFDNSAVSAGGFELVGPATAALVNCHIAGNDASGGPSGAGVQGSGGVLKVTNCTVVGNNAQVGGGVGAHTGGHVDVQNSILYFNNDTVSVGEGEQITVVGATGTMAHSCVQCLGASSTIPQSTNCTGANPSLLQPAGSDGIFGTLDDVILLKSFSPCIDAGSTALLPLDADDMDEDGNVAEQLPFDQSGQGLRVKDDSAVANGRAGFVDIGATERQSASFGALPIPADLDGNGSVGATDLAILLGAFGTSGPLGDLNGSCSVDSADLATLLGAWSE